MLKGLLTYLCDNKLTMEFVKNNDLIKRTYIKCYSLYDEHLSIYTPTAELQVNLENFKILSVDTIAGIKNNELHLIFDSFEKHKNTSVHLCDENDKLIISIANIQKAA